MCVCVCAHLFTNGTWNLKRGNHQDSSLHCVKSLSYFDNSNSPTHFQGLFFFFTIHDLPYHLSTYLRTTTYHTYLPTYLLPMNYLLLTYKKKLCWIFFLLGFVHYPYLFSLQKVFTFPQNWVLSTFPPIPNTTTTTTTTTKNSCLRVWTLNLFFLQKCITLTFYLFKIFQRYNKLYSLYML